MKYSECRPQRDLDTVCSSGSQSKLSSSSRGLPRSGTCAVLAGGLVHQRLLLSRTRHAGSALVPSSRHSVEDQGLEHAAHQSRVCRCLREGQRRPL